MTGDINYFDAIKFWDIGYSDIQKVIQKVSKTQDLNHLIIFCGRQVGKSFWIYRDLFEDAIINPGEKYGIIIPKSGEMKRFLAEQLTKPFGKNKYGEFCKDIETARIPIQVGNKIQLIKFVKSFSTQDGVPVLVLFNDSKIFMYSGNANPESHIAGYTFKKLIQDEWSKFDRNISDIIQPTLIQKNGLLISATTLNDFDGNWFDEEICKDFIKNENYIQPNTPIEFCGLDIYRKSINFKVTMMNSDGTYRDDHISGKNIMIKGDFDKCYPWVYNGQNAMKRVLADLKLKTISQDTYERLYCNNPNTGSSKILYAFNEEIHTVDIDDIDESMFDIQLLGYDHGKGTDTTCDAAFGRIGLKLNKDKTDIDCFVILESKPLNGIEAETESIAKTLVSYDLPISCDNTLFKQVIRDFSDIMHFYKLQSKLRGLMFPAGGDKRYNRSSDRVNFWQACFEGKRKVRDKKTKEFVEESMLCEHVVTKKLGPFKILVATSKKDHDLNRELIHQIQTWKKKRNSRGELREVKSKIDVWDCVSYGISGASVNLHKLILFFRKRQERMQLLNIPIKSEKQMPHRGRKLAY